MCVCVQMDSTCRHRRTAFAHFSMTLFMYFLVFGLCFFRPNQIRRVNLPTSGRFVARACNHERFDAYDARSKWRPHFPCWRRIRWRPNLSKFRPVKSKQNRNSDNTFRVFSLKSRDMTVSFSFDKIDTVQISFFFFFFVSQIGNWDVKTSATKVETF